MGIDVAINNLSIIRKGLLLIAGSLLIQGIFLWTISATQRVNTAAQAAANHCSDVLAAGEATLAQVAIIEASTAGYVATQEQGWLERYHDAAAQLPQDLAQFEHLVADDASQSQRVKGLHDQVQGFLARHAALITAAGAGPIDHAARRAWDPRSTDQLRDDLQQILAAEKTFHLISQATLAHSQSRLRALLVSGLGASILFCVVVALGFSRSVSTRFAQLAENARRLVQGDRTVPPMTGHDEIAAIDGAFRELVRDWMADRDALASQTRVWESVLDSMGEAVVVVDNYGHLILENRAAQRLSATLTTSAADVPSKTLGYLGTGIQQVIDNTLAGENVDGCELLLPHLGSPAGMACLAITGRPLHDADGARHGAVIVCRDVTSQKRAARQLVALVEMAPDAMIIVDGAGNIRLANELAELLFGYDPQELIGQPIELLIPERFRERHIEHRSAYHTGPHLRPMGASLELFGLRKNTQEFPLEISLIPLETDEGVWVASVIRDITERKRAESASRRAQQELEHRVLERTAELSKANRELAHRNEENEAFVYSVSHDLRSPLVNLLGFSKELDSILREVREIALAGIAESDASARLSDLLENEAPVAVHFIQNGVSRLNRIIDALLRLSRSGRVNYQSVEIELPAIVSHVIDGLSSSIRERGATLTVGELPTVLGDPSAVELIFANLIGNAIKYADPARPCHVEISCVEPLESVPSEDGLPLCTLQVKDNGLGIPASGHNRIFRVFQRLHPNSGDGEGVGLAMIERIVIRHKGRVWFESQEGVGTTFFVQLPSARTMRATTFNEVAALSGV